MERPCFQALKRAGGAPFLHAPCPPLHIKTDKYQKIKNRRYN